MEGSKERNGATNQSVASAQAPRSLAGSALFDIIGTKLVPSLYAAPFAQPGSLVNKDMCSEAGAGFELSLQTAEVFAAISIGIHPDIELVLVLSDDLHRHNEKAQPLPPLPFRIIGWPSLAFDAPM